MNGRLKRTCALLLCLVLLPGGVNAMAEGNEEILSQFVLHHGDRNVPKIAITVDDCYKTATEWIAKDVELCKQYGIAMTFFPLVNTGCLEEKYRDLWQSVLDAGCEIGGLGKAQEATDKTLGYHYEIRWLRPPTGNIDSGSKSTKQQVISAVKQYGFDHIVHWDVSETIDLKKALKNIQNGSILLFHAKKKDSNFLEKLIPELKDRGFEMVTVSELFGFDPPATSSELYVYN